MRDKINGLKLRKCQSVPAQILWRFIQCFVCVCVKALQHPCLSCYTSTVLYAWNNSAASGKIFMKFDIGELFKICGEGSSLIAI
jgi:hypothetical protein